MKKKTDLSKQKKPIYLWILTDAGVIEQHNPITKYALYEFPKESRIIMNIDEHICYTKLECFDKMLHNRVYSYNKDLDVRKIITDAILHKIKVARANYERQKQIYEKILAL